MVGLQEEVSRCNASESFILRPAGRQCLRGGVRVNNLPFPLVVRQKVRNFAARTKEAVYGYNYFKHGSI